VQTNQMMINTIDRDSPIPLYHQLSQIFEAKIKGGEWAVGGMIPSEQELQQMYDLSRTTVRLALGELVSEGRLTRQRGRGTFVATPKLAHDLASGRSLSDYLLQQGSTPSWQVIRREWTLPDDSVRALLQLENGIGVYYVELLFSADSIPIGHHSAYVPKTILDPIQHAQFDDSAWLTYMRHLPLTDGFTTRRTIEAVNLSHDKAALLDIDTKTPVLAIEAVTVDEKGDPVQLIKALFNGQRFKYQLKG
jgi:GntR family transcriptional regulator